MKDYHRIAQEIIQVVGKDNILSATHCATRLRFMVKDRDAINDKKVEASMIKFPKDIYVIPLKERQLRVLKVEEGKTYTFKIENRR